MRITLMEPYLTGSHRAWAEGYRDSSQHKIQVLAMEGRFWKWRMHGGALELAAQSRGLSPIPNLLLVTDMVNLPRFWRSPAHVLAMLPSPPISTRTN
jgi:hypothetical protein